MRWLIVWMALAGISYCPAWCEEQSGTQPQQTTQVAGTVPDLAGRWLVVTRVEIAPKSGLGTTTASLWNVTTAGGKPEVTLREVGLPAELQASLDKANAAHAIWEPSAAELRDLQQA